MNIQYVNKVPNKMEIYELMDSMQIDVHEEDIFVEDESTITSVCAYHLEKIVGIGKVEKEQDKLYIQDILVRPEYRDEQIENNIIVTLLRQVNDLKRFNSSIQKCLDMGKIEENFFNKFSFLNNKEKQELGA